MAHSTTCPVIFADGTPCPRLVDHYPSKGWCDACANWSLGHDGADPNGRKAHRRPGAEPGFCSYPGCGRPLNARRLCDRHYRQLLKGEPLRPLQSQRRKNTVMALLRAAAHATMDDCIILDGYASRPKVAFGGKHMSASRAVWIIANGDPAPDVHILHKLECNGGSGDHGCINIRHLYDDSHDRNMRDKIEAGHHRGWAVTSNRGSDHPQSKLTEADIQDIRVLVATGLSQTAIAERFGVRQAAVSRIIRRVTWAWLDYGTHQSETFTIEP